MGYISLFLMAVGLCFDTFAVSVSCGLLKRKICFLQAFRMACIFAIVQGVMPLIGWLLGRTVEPFIASYDHWVAFGLLAAIGGKMIYESIKKPKADAKPCDSVDLKTTFGMAIATSIDALIVGVSIALIQLSELKLVALVLMVVLITGIAAMLGMWAGKRFGHKLERQSVFIGGTLLMLIGTKVLLEHTVFTS